MTSLPLFSRAVRLRCPGCGSGPIFTSWLHMVPACPVCALHFDREARGYWLGSYTLNIFLTETVWVTAFLIAAFLTWPTPPWDALEYGSVALMVTVPFLIYPWTKTLYLAIDLSFRPAEEDDFTAPHEVGFTHPKAQENH